MSLITTPCVLFAGGKSSRMGEDKAFLPFGTSESLIAYQVQRLNALFDRVYISAKEPSLYSHLKTSVIQDRYYSEIAAPTTGFYNIYQELQEDSSFFVLSVDTPFVDEAIISELFAVDYEQYDAVVVKTPLGVHPLCGIYTRALEPFFKSMIEKNDHKIMKLLKESNVFYLKIDDEEALLNLNTPSEYQKALAQLKAQELNKDKPLHK